MELDTAVVVGWIIQLKELLALVSLIVLIWFIMTKHIPFLMMREAERAEREATRHQKNYDTMMAGFDKLSDTLRDGLSELKDSVVSHQISVDKAAANVSTLPSSGRISR
jgi:hypothetical protein